MLKQTFTLFIICFAGLSVLGQTEKHTAPVKWERYKVSDKNVSVLFPKLPILIRNSDFCSEMESRRYGVYAENVVYGLNITSETNQKAPDYCRQLGELRKFDDRRFEDRLNELKASLKTDKTEKTTRNDLEVIKISDEFFAYWLINDFKNKRWFEVWTTDRDETNLKIKNFIASFIIEKNPLGIEVEKGANRAYGDENANILEEKNMVGSENAEIQNLRIILKPKASYTEAARQSSVQGVVRLRVTFLANGGIGTVSVVSSLPLGLTEEAVAAASKIVFIPAKKNKINYTVIKTVEYSFSIY